MPTTAEQCAAVLAGDLSGIEAGEGWPMEGLLVSMRTAERHGVELPGWFVTLDGVVIGDAEVGNVPSRRALESAGFVLERADEQHTWYALSPS